MNEVEVGVRNSSRASRLLEANVHPGEPTRVDTLFNLNDGLSLPEGVPPHFKSGFTAQGRVIVANNTYQEISVSPGEYVHHEFPDGFGAHWVRLQTGVDAEGVTAHFVYN